MIKWNKAQMLLIRSVARAAAAVTIVFFLFLFSFVICAKRTANKNNYNIDSTQHVERARSARPQ